MKPDGLTFYEDFEQKNFEEENLSLSSLGDESRVIKHLLSWTGSLSMTDTDQNETQAWTQFEDNIEFVVFFILCYFLQFINNVSCNI